jgi:hypothetical protein
MWGRLYRLVLADPIAYIDDFQAQPSPGPRSPAFTAWFSAIAVAVLLTLMNFYVLDGSFQSKAAELIAKLVGWLPEGTVRTTLEQVQPLYRNITWSLGCLTLYFIVPALIIRLVFREPLSNYGLSVRGFIRHLPIYLLLFLPVFGAVVVVSYTTQFQDTYPFYHYPLGVWDLLAWEFFYCLQFFALEFFFRGFMVHAMKHRMGSLAVFAMVVPYCMIHFQKPFAEALAAILAGTVLGVLSLRTNTIWGGVFIHSAVAVTMDWASLIQRGVPL